MTATSIVGVDRVVFVRGGTVLPVPGPDGSIDRGCPRRGRLRRHSWRPANRPSTAPCRCPAADHAATTTTTEP